MTAEAVADLVGGRLSGNGAALVGRLRSLEGARPGDIAVCGSIKYAPAMATSGASVVLVGNDVADHPGPETRILVDDPGAAAALVAARFHPPTLPRQGIHDTALIGDGTAVGSGCRIGPRVVIGANCVIGSDVSIGPGSVLEDDVVIGDGTRIDALVVIHHGVVVGRRVRCKAGAVIGGDGFGFHSDRNGHVRSPQIGGCIIEDDVEIGSSSCIDRGSLDDTVIGAGTKIDNLVHVGHNVRIGRHCLLVAGVGISGSTRVGDGVVLAGQAGVVGHISIGDGARIGAQAGVIASVPAGSSVSGYPARPHREFLRAQAALYRLAPHVDTLEQMADREGE